MRLTIGDDNFFRLLRTWVRSNKGGNVTIPQFIALAERISGQDLDGFFKTWLFTAGKPDLPAAATASTTLASGSRADGMSAAVLMKRLQTHH